MRRHSSSRKPWRKNQRRRRHWLSRLLPRNLLFGLLAIGALFVVQQFTGGGQISTGIEAEQGVAARSANRAGDISCHSPYIIDGDTLECGGHRIRLASIDAPELSPCTQGRRCTPGDPHASKAYLQSISRGAVSCRSTDTDRYGRTVALCDAGGKDLSCAMVAAGHAVERYGSLSCP